jgi:hypothetical protein
MKSCSFRSCRHARQSRGRLAEYPFSFNLHAVTAAQSPNHDATQVAAVQNVITMDGRKVAENVMHHVARTLSSEESAIWHANSLNQSINSQPLGNPAEKLSQILDWDRRDVLSGG